MPERLSEAKFERRKLRSVENISAGRSSRGQNLEGLEVGVCL